MSSPNTTSVGAGALAQPTARVPNVLTTLGRHPALLSALKPLLTTTLPQGLLPKRDRELVILRLSYGLRSHYEWVHHIEIGTRYGLTEQEIARIPAGPDAPGWSAFDAALLRAVDDLRGPQASIADATRQQLMTRYDEPQLLELLAVIGTYTMLAYILNSCDVPLEDWVTDPPALPEA